MWQRVQTLYLAIATALIAIMLFSEKAEGVSYVSYIPYLVLLILITLLNFLALTTYKFRMFQFRTAGLAAILTIALQTWLVVDFVFTHNDLIFKITAVFPIVAVIFDILAARNIWADELMVRSASRLRSAKHKKQIK